jgi:hypothetical protein
VPRRLETPDRENIVSKTKNQLDFKHHHRLNVWSDANREKFRGATREEIADMASEALGFTITRNNIIGVIRVLEIDTEKEKPLQPELFVAQNLAALTERVEQLEQELHKLRTLEARVRDFTSSMANTVQELTKRVNENEIIVERTAARVLGRAN